ncbi:serine/threonine-protein kinase [Lentisphaera profundi]|uniref:non-specific serine/threonine protein kinase n=1 Tax=Lentisphaera profundi TaxID=1658616 RepID=A0ABY7VTU3_9BACT|nr:serine/threonine-protein kinase [Lentisphaera profundi]WDE96174.1 serine/threonine-protein kinase [Lentisphaera profundi]
MTEPPDETEDFVNKVHDLGHYFEKAFDGSESESPLYDKFLLNEKRYEDLEKVDEGGTKSISVVYDEQTYRPIAMAKLKEESDKGKYDSFLSEAFLTASLEHPNIVPLYEAGLDKNHCPYFTMKLIEGQNLSDYIKQAKEKAADYTLQHVIDIFLKVCDAIAFAHSRNVIHLDLKPDNIRLGTYGEVLLCDWGIAKLLEEGEVTSHTQNNLDPNIINDHTLDGVIKGTLGFLAPEQIESKIGLKSKQTDIYQLGAILYNMLCLEKPVQTKSSKQSIQDTLEGNIISPKKYSHDYFQIPESLVAVCMKALSKEPQDRYVSVDELKDEIIHWREGFATDAEDASFLRAISLLIKRHKLVSLLLGCFCVSTSFFVFEIRKNEQEAISNAILAERNAQLAQENEKRALNALEMYVKEKALSKQVGIEASPRLVDMGVVHLHKGHFMEAQRVFKRARNLDRNNEVALYFQALTQFVRQDFKGFLYYMSKKTSLTKDSRKTIFLARKYMEIKGDRNRLEFTKLLALINEMPFTRPAYLLALDHHQTHPPNREKHQLIQVILEKTNPQVKVWDYAIKNLPNGYDVDFRKTPKVRVLTALRGLPLNKMNLDGCELQDGEEIAILILKELSMRNTQMKKLGFILNMPSLEKLILSEGDHSGWDFSKYPKIQVEHH